MSERVSGPLRGYYVAAYACPMGELGNQYLGYYKLCSDEPSSYWDCDCLVKGCADEICSTPEAALESAFRLAADQVGNLPYLPTRYRSRRQDDPTLPLEALHVQP